MRLAGSEPTPPHRPAYLHPPTCTCSAWCALRGVGRTPSRGRREELGARLQAAERELSDAEATWRRAVSEERVQHEERLRVTKAEGDRATASLQAQVDELQGQASIHGGITKTTAHRSDPTAPPRSPRWDPPGW